FLPALQCPSPTPLLHSSRRQCQPVPLPKASSSRPPSLAWCTSSASLRPRILHACWSPPSPPQSTRYSTPSNRAHSAPNMRSSPNGSLACNSTSPSSAKPPCATPSPTGPQSRSFSISAVRLLSFAASRRFGPWRPTLKSSKSFSYASSRSRLPPRRRREPSPCAAAFKSELPLRR
ncbi:hypothetical protein B0H11DRAFT_508011, partial [Mycena galericulata]